MNVTEWSLDNGVARITLQAGEPNLWRYELPACGWACSFAAPVFPLDGALVPAVLETIEEVSEPRVLSNGVVEHRFLGPFAHAPELSLELVFRLSEGDPIVRFRYLLHSETRHKLTRIEGEETLVYLTASWADLPQVTELRFSEFNEMLHSYTLVERPVRAREFLEKGALIGPMLAAEGKAVAALLAYEHGATVPDSYLEYQLRPNREVRLQAIKGNYQPGQTVEPERPFETIWFQAAAVSGDKETLSRSYRAFALERLSTNSESREPYIFYNTWNYQERNHHWNARPYLESMNEGRMLEEIEVAHRLGIDVFVIDTGWYEATGDWRVSAKRFPNGLAPIKKKLDGYGMKMGLWFNPTVASVSSELLKEHKDCIISWRGKRAQPHAIWETEESYPMCLVSPYGNAFADRLIALHRELGVNYFKWDAVGQGGCDDPNHWHGDAENTPEERAACHSFQLGLAMMQIVERLREACPEAIVDFDVTESGRFVGLGWLAASKYYLVNNGPYYHDYNLPLPPDNNWNMFFYPGPARGWICRSVLDYDKWIPSVLFMTHYFPDEPESSQLINAGSLILGQNGLWGDLPSLSEEAIARFGEIITHYKRVKHDITESYPVRTGPIAGTPEIHEKISTRTGRGAVVIFSTRRGRFSYLTHNRTVADCWRTEGLTVTRQEDGCALLEADFAEGGAKIALFGATEP